MPGKVFPVLFQTDAPEVWLREIISNGTVSRLGLTSGLAERVHRRKMGQVKRQLPYFENEIFCTFWINNEVYSTGYCTGYDEPIVSGINRPSAGIVIAL
jgi:hypothetical protein